MSKERKLVPVKEFPFPEPGPEHFQLTCKNHPTAKYLTKNPWNRGLHVIELPKGDIPRTATGECTCPFSDLVVIILERQ